MAARILILSPDSNLSTMIEARLCVEDFQTDIAEDGETAFFLIKEKKPGIILLDAKLPRMSARKFVEILRGNPETEKILVIILSDKKDFQYLFEGTAIFGFLTKPVIPAELMRLVRKAAKTLEPPAPTGPEIVKVPPKTVFLAGTQAFLLEKLKKDLEAIKYHVEIGWSKEHIAKRIFQLEPPPLLFLLQYWEQTDAWNAVDIVLDLRLELALKKINLIVFCNGSLVFDVKRELPGVTIIGHRESTDLMEQVKRYLERFEVDQGRV